MKGSLPIFILLCSTAVSFAWDLKPDPPADKPWAAKPGLSIPNPQRSFRVEFADGHGPFVLLGDRDSVREVYDLRTGERTARFDCRERRTSWQPEHLSPDGRVWATADSYSQVRLLDTASGRVLGTCQLPGSYCGAKFLAPDRLVVVVWTDRGPVAQVFAAADAKLLHSWPFDVRGDEFLGQLVRHIDVSPGGAYLAAAGPRTVVVVSLADGKKVVELDPPAVRLRPGERPRLGVAFSADGRELAVLAGAEREKAGALAVWGLKDGGKTETAVERAERPTDEFTPPLAPVLSGGWLVDGTRVWVGGKLAGGTRQPAAERRLALTPELVIGRSWTEGADDTPVAAIPDTPRPFRPNDSRPEFDPPPPPPAKDVPIPANPRAEAVDDLWNWAATVGGGLLVFAAGLAVVIVLVVVRRKRRANGPRDDGGPEG